MSCATPQDRTVAPVLHLPDGQNYTCHQSGLCCPVFPRIPLDDVSAKRLEDLDFSRVAETGVGSAAEAITTEPDTGEKVVARRKGDCNCVFYGEDKLCAIHKAFGEPAKPQVCRDFPYRYRNTPGGVYVGLSFVCPSVRGNKGQAVLEQQTELEGGYRQALRHQDVPATILLNRKLEISWDEYLAVEAALLEILGRADFSLERRLIALAVFIAYVDLMHRGASGDYMPMAPPRRAPEGQIPAIVETMRRTGYAEVFRATGRGAGSPVLQRMFLGMISSFGNSLWENRGRVRAMAGILGKYAAHATPLGRVRLEPVRSSVSHGQLARVTFPATGDAAELLHRYLHHCIFRKDLLFARDLCRGLNLLLINAALLRWYAAALAVEGGRTLPGDDDFSEAVRHVETYYGLQSRFYRTLSKHEVLDDIVESFTRRKNFPFVIIGQSA